MSAHMKQEKCYLKQETLSHFNNSLVSSRNIAFCDKVYV